MSIETLKALSTIRALTTSGRAREIRERHKLSLTEMAEAIPAGVSTLARWELGDRRPRGEAALRYLEVLRSLDPDALADAS